MTTTEKLLLVLVIVIVIFLLFHKKIMSIFNRVNTNPLSPIPGSACTTSSGKAGTIINGVCVETAVIPAEGSSCTKFGAPGTIINGQCALYNGNPCTDANGDPGTVVQGVCVSNSSNNNPPNITLKNYKIQVQKIAGAKLYSYINNQFIVTGTILPYGKEVITDGYVTSPKVYYRTADGWLDKDDMGITQILP